MKFELVSPFKPTGDQPQAIEKLTKNLQNGKKNQVLVGVTGSGKTFTMANVINAIQKPTLVISHNKTLAGQLYQEFREFFPKNAVSYFVSYYDYYQPEVYIPHTDTYIEKEVEINEEIDKLRLSSTTNLLTRPDTLVVASVSCIYNLGSPVEYGKFILEAKVGMETDQKSICLRFTDLQYERNDYDFKRGTFRVRGDDVSIFPAYVDYGIEFVFEGNKIKGLRQFDPLTGDTMETLSSLVIYPAKHYMTDPTNYEAVFAKIRQDLVLETDAFKKRNKLVEAQRLLQRTTYDLQMIKEVGFVNGIENYSRYFDGRKPGDPPYTLLDYFEHVNKDWLLIVDESHMTMPQIRGMYNGDRARKETLINYGFRLNAAYDNRPLRFDEFMRRTHRTVFVSATPNDYEVSLSQEGKGIGVVEQLIRPTGLIDPHVTIKPTKGQIEDLIVEINKRVAKHERVLVTTLTKRMAEELSSFLEERNMKVAYLHSDIETLERQDVLDDLRSGAYDVLIGINLLREGLDLPEVSLVAILDADKEGFLRSRTSLVQTMGRAARNINAHVIMYADVETKSMKAAIAEVERRRNVQIAYNKKHHITPLGIIKSIRAKMVEKEIQKSDSEKLVYLGEKDVLLPDETEKLISMLRREMKKSAQELDFETATILRDRIRKHQST